MLYWICPECGHECSPAIRECPTCTAPPKPAPEAAVPVAATKEVQQPAPQPATESDELLSLARNFESSTTALLAPAQQRESLLSANGHETSVTNGAIAVEEEEAVESEPELSQTLAPLGKVNLKPARLSRVAPVKLPVLPIPLPIASPAFGAAAPATRAGCALETAGPAPAGEVDFQAARASERAAISPSALPSRRQSVAFLRAELPGAACGGIALAALQPLAPPAPGAEIGKTNGICKPPLGKLGSPSVLRSGLELAGQSLSELLNALKSAAEEVDRSGIEAIHRSFAALPGIALLTAPKEVITAPAPAAWQCLPEKPKFTPVEPEGRGRAFAIVGPQAPTLAGPSLPPQLLHLNHQPAKFRPRRRQWSLWPLSVIIITVLILGVGSALQYFTQDRDTRAASVVAPAQTTKPAVIARAPIIEEHPAARSVEVAGIRIISGPNKKPQLQFIVINHSGSEITGLNIHIALRSVDAPADTPLLTVSSPVATLGPNQSKEIRAEVNTPVQTSQIPDWQSLRTEVLIGRQ